MLVQSELACLLALSTLSVVACGESSAASASQTIGATPVAGDASFVATSAAPAASRSDDATADAALQRALSIAIGLPSALAASVQTSRGMLVEAVYFATASTGAAALGQVTMTGTVTVGANGTTYAPSPSDRLVVKVGGETHEIVVQSVQGNAQAATAADWIASPHVLKYTHKVGERAEAQVAVQFDGTRFDVKTKGWAKLGGERYDVNLSGAGALQGSRDLDGHELKLQYDLTGEIKGVGSEIAVKEHHALQSAASYSLRMLTTQRGTASASQARVANVLKHGGAKYELADVDVRWEGVDKGNQQRSGVTALAGTILRDTRPFATCALSNGVPVAATPDGKAIRLDDLPVK